MKTLAVAFAFILVTFLKAQDNNSKYTYSIGLTAQFPFENCSPLSLQGEAFKKNYFATLNASFFTRNKTYSSAISEYKYITNASVVNLMGGIKTGEHKRLEFSLGYTGIFTSFDNFLYVPNEFKNISKGNALKHFITFNTGFRWSIKNWYLKPTLSLNYLLQESIDFSLNETEYYSGYILPKPNPKGYLYNFQPTLKLELGYIFGK